MIQGGSGKDEVYGDGGPEDGFSQAGYGNDQIVLGAGDDYDLDREDGERVDAGIAANQLEWRLTALPYDKPILSSVQLCI